MVEFEVLIHKETGTVIPYDNWIGFLKERTIYIWREKSTNGDWRYTPKEMLFSEDFVIVYKQDFTTLELIQLYSGIGNLRPKLKRLIDDRHNIQHDYNYDFKWSTDQLAGRRDRLWILDETYIE